MQLQPLCSFLKTHNVTGCALATTLVALVTLSGSINAGTKPDSHSQSRATTRVRLQPYWNFSLPHEVTLATPIIYSSLVYIPAFKNITALNLETGRKLWEAPVNNYSATTHPFPFELMVTANSVTTVESIGHDHKDDTFLLTTLDRVT